MPENAGSDMDGQRFDDAMRALDGAISRRRGLVAAVGVLLAGVSRGEAAARRRRRSRDDGDSVPPQQPGNEGPCGDGSREENACTEDRQCCTFFCDTTLQNNDGLGRCRCVKRGAPCTRRQRCCGKLSCTDGLCQIWPPPCGPTACPAGCCQGGVCQSGTASDACGTGGVACVACSGATPACVAGACAASV